MRSRSGSRSSDGSVTSNAVTSSTKRHKNAIVSPALNCEHPAQLFDDPEAWLPPVASDEEQEQLEDQEQEEQRAQADTGGTRLKHLLDQDQDLEFRSRLLPKQGPRGEEGLGEKRHPLREKKHRECWNFLYRKDLAIEVARRRLLRGARQLWFFTVQHVVLQHAALLAFILLSANDNIIKSLSKRHLDGEDARPDFPYAVSSVLLVASLMSGLGGSVAALCLGGRPALRKCWNIWSILHMSPVSMLFQFGALLKFMSLKYLAPDMVSMLSQMNLVMLAVALRFWMGKRYRKSQWLDLAMTTLTMVQYATVRDAHSKGQMNESPMQLSAEVVTGVSIIITMCVAETVASVLAEKQFKARQEAFYVLKVHSDLSGSVFAALWCFVLEPFILKDFGLSCNPQRCRQVIDRGFFSGWDRWTLLVLAMSMSKMWLAGLIVRVLDSVVKQLGSCLATVLTYLEVVWIYPNETIPDFATFVALALVVMAIGSFALSTRDSLTIDRLREDSTQDSHTIERLREEAKSSECDASWTQSYQRPSSA